MNVKTQNIIASIYEHRESFISTYPWFNNLKEKGLYPKFVVMDGERSVMLAIRQTWPKTKIQRCLWHIQREGLRWLRTYPKTQAGVDLRKILLTLCDIKTIKERNIFIKNYNQWILKYKDFIKSLSLSTIALKDLKKTMALIKNALPNMFHYLKDPNIPSTTNTLESFYSRLKADYNKHRGLSKSHRVCYLKWYCYLKNNNTF